jgi:hypothetical protein
MNIKNKNLTVPLRRIQPIPCQFRIGRWCASFLTMLLIMAMSAADSVAITIVQCDAPVQSRKRGIGVNSLSAADFTALAPGVSWYYNWGIAPLSTKPAGVVMDYVPMVWNAAGVSGLSSYLAGGARPWRILGLNEPNWIYQANMNPQACATAFAQIKALADPYSIPVIAPNMMIGTSPGESVTAFDPIQGTNVTYTFQQPFLDAFLYYCGASKPPGMATHSYGGYGETNWITTTMRSAYPTQSVWVTEFNHSGATNDMTVLSTMIETVDFLERTPWVEGYAWFMARITGDPYNSLLTGSDGVLSAAGQTYVQMPVHDANIYYRIPGRLQAERYVTVTNAKVQATADMNGLLDMTSTSAGGSIDYNIQANTAGTYQLNLRTFGATGAITIYRGATLLGTANVTSAGWSVVSTNVALIAGTQTLRVVMASNGQRVNWMEFALTSAVPAVPTGVMAAPGSGQVALSWTPTAGATSYNVKRSTTSGGSYTTVGSPTSPSFTNTGLTNGTTYYYVVSAVKSAGQSANSSQVSAQPLAGATVGNFGFETPSTGSYVMNPGSASWTFTGSAGVSANQSGYTAGNPNAPQGVQVGILQSNASISQTLTGLTVGATYLIQVSAAQRASYGGAQSFDIRINGTTKGSVSSMSANYANYTATFVATATSHTLAFVGTTTGDNTAFIDNVRVTVQAAALTVPNFGFETPTTSTYVMNPSGGSWTFSGSTGVSANGSAYTSGNPSAPQGAQVAVLSSNSTISQSVSGFTNGTSYTIRVAATRRANWGGVPTFVIQVNGVTKATINTLTTSYVDYSATFTTTGGPNQTISFVGTTAGDNTAFLDNVRITSP